MDRELERARCLRNDDVDFLDFTKQVFSNFDHLSETSVSRYVQLQKLTKAVIARLGLVPGLKNQAPSSSDVQRPRSAATNGDRVFFLALN